MHERNRNLLKKLGTIVYLRSDPVVLFERMQAKGLPLFLREDPSIEHLERLWQERHVVYAQLADHTIDNTHLNISATADSVLAALSESGFTAPEA
jgi:shikimate kinase